MAQPGYPPVAQPYNPPVSQPTTSDPKAQTIYPPPPPAGYPPLSQPNYTQAPQPGYTNVPPAGYPPVSQPGYSTAPPAGYPPVSQPGYSTAPLAGHPPVSHPNYTPSAAVPAPTPQPRYNAITYPLPVLGPQYCLPHLVDLAVTRKLMTLTDDFVVTDVNKNVMFKVRGKFFTLHDKRVLIDSTGKLIVTLRHKILTAHSRWLAYRGDSSESKDLLFTAKTSSVIQLKTKLNVYLANRTSEVFCDFKVQGSWFERSCVIYVGESKTIAAQMHMKESAGSYFLGKDTFIITIYPNVDYAFIVALIVILDAINTSDDV